MSTLAFGAVAQGAEGLVLMLHGVGADPASLAPLARRIARQLPACAIRVPPAPDPFPSSHGRQWFSIDGVTHSNRPQRIAAALPGLTSIADTELAAFGLGRDRLALVGFSQGAMMALALAASDSPPASTVAIAGRLAVERISSRAASTDVLLLHGSLDPVVPVTCALDAAAVLRLSGRQVRVQVETGLAHAISPAQADAVVDHLTRTFPRAREKAAAA